MEYIVKYIFIIVGTLIVSLVMFHIIFGTVGQTQLYRVSNYATMQEWKEFTMDSGTTRSAIIGISVEGYENPLWSE